MVMKALRSSPGMSGSGAWETGTDGCCMVECAFLVTDMSWFGVEASALGITVGVGAVTLVSLWAMFTHACWLDFVPLKALRTSARLKLKQKSSHVSVALSIRSKRSAVLSRVAFCMNRSRFTVSEYSGTVPPIESCWYRCSMLRNALS